MKFASTRLVTNDLDVLSAFYGMLTGVPPVRLNEDFAMIPLPGAILAMSSERSVREFNAGAATAGANRSAIVEFLVDDVDAVRERLWNVSIDVAMGPTDMPWGNRSMLVRDPDGNLINIFAPIRQSAQAQNA